MSFGLLGWMKTQQHHTEGLEHAEQTQFSSIISQILTYLDWDQTLGIVIDLLMSILIKDSDEKEAGSTCYNSKSSRNE